MLGSKYFLLPVGLFCFVLFSTTWQALVFRGFCILFWLFFCNILDELEISFPTNTLQIHTQNTLTCQNKLFFASEFLSLFSPYMFSQTEFFFPAAVGRTKHCICKIEKPVAF